MYLMTSGLSFICGSELGWGTFEETAFLWAIDAEDETWVYFFELSLDFFHSGFEFSEIDFFFDVADCYFEGGEQKGQRGDDAVLFID